MKFSYTIHSISTALISVVTPFMKFNEPKGTWVIYSAECYSCLYLFSTYSSPNHLDLLEVLTKERANPKNTVSPPKITSRWNVQ